MTLAFVLAMALAGAAILAMSGCGPRNETLTCKDGTFTSGQGARQVCDVHGGVRGE